MRDKSVVRKRRKEVEKAQRWKGGQDNGTQAGRERERERERLL